ncbi:MAG: MarR family transcriptional regulator [Acidimicrobiales bacterium]
MTRTNPRETAARAWADLRDFVDGHHPRRELQEILGLGRGLGRVKTILLLTSGPATLREIAEFLGVDAPYATVIVNKLKDVGLVERIAHPDDHRRKLVQLTLAGREAARLANRVYARPPDALASLPPDDLTTLEAILAKLTTKRGD